MQKRKKLVTKVSGIGLLLLSITFFSNCKKNSSEEVSVPNDSLNISATSATSAAGTGFSATLKSDEIKSYRGHAYSMLFPTQTDGDIRSNPLRSTLKLYEDGREIGPAHAEVEDVIALGHGRFRHRDNTLIFSTSDNSNPQSNGRTYTVKSSSTSSTSKPVSAPQLGNVPMGYAMINGTTTGGKGGTEVTVTTLKDLKSAAADVSTKIIYISGAIKGAGEDPIWVKSNKSFIGRSGASIEGAEFYVYGVKNIIFQNLTFRHYVVSAALQIKESANHIWVDHCDFGNDKQHGWEHWGKDITMTREADFITVSWCKFHDTFLSVLISGGIEGHEADAGKLNITMHHNFWYNVSEREPSMNYGRVHMFNNYHLNNTGYSIGTRAGGIVRTDNEYFLNCNRPLSTKVAQDPVGYFSGISTNIYDKCGPNNITTKLSTWVPPYEYKSYLDLAANVPSIVTKSAGPK